MCPLWSRLGYCPRESQFMYFHCRESCGSCGFKSGTYALALVKGQIESKCIHEIIDLFSSPEYRKSN
jgi:hypothetical protein